MIWPGHEHLASLEATNLIDKFLADKVLFLIEYLKGIIIYSQDGSLILPLQKVIWETITQAKNLKNSDPTASLYFGWQIVPSKKAFKLSYSWLAEEWLTNNLENTSCMIMKLLSMRTKFHSTLTPWNLKWSIVVPSLGGRLKEFLAWRVRNENRILKMFNQSNDASVRTNQYAKFRIYLTLDLYFVNFN